ncbi:hypothetical protein [Epilithonimonas tenax]|uniref:hypothetical protein n=1 Tax=Epilithonimonas tenax TaxID=191577 RepID=UPI000429150B|nr:hypothetical protein [Epilithonimonas tenax]
MNTIILLVVLAILIFVLAYYWDKNYRNINDIRTYEDVEKLAEFDGDFEYRDEGFYLKLKESRRFIRWDEIINVISKKYSVAGESKMVYEIKTVNESFEIDLEKSGFYKFKIKLDDNLQIINNWQNVLSKNNRDDIIFERDD